MTIGEFLFNGFAVVVERMNMKRADAKIDIDTGDYETDKYIWESERDDYDENEDGLKAGKSMIDDIDDRLDAEFMSGEPSVELTAQADNEFGHKRFRTIPEE